MIAIAIEGILILIKAGSLTTFTVDVVKVVTRF